MLLVLKWIGMRTTNHNQNLIITDGLFDISLKLIFFEKIYENRPDLKLKRIEKFGSGMGFEDSETKWFWSP